MRRIVRSPGFSTSVVLILAVGVGAATAMSSVLYALSMRPLSLPDARALVAVTSIDLRGPRTTPLQAIDHLNAAQLSADGWCAYTTTIDSTESSGRVLDAYGEILAGQCPKVIGLNPRLGRWFSTEEAPIRGKAQPVVVITDRYWKRMFDSAPDVLGRTIRLQDVTLAVIGVMPESYQGFSSDLSADLILPFNAHRATPNAASFLGRLRPGGTVEQLRAEVRGKWHSVLEAVIPQGPTRAQTLAEWKGDAQSHALGSSILRRLYAAPLSRLALLTIALLGLVCVNVGGLLVSRFTSRAQEISAMRALGADTRRVLYPLAAETSILAAAGTLLGIPIAYAASAAFRSLLPIGNMPWTTETTPDGIVFAAVAAGLVLITVLISAPPIWLTIRLRPEMRQTDSLRRASRKTSRWARALLVSQLALTITLVFTCAVVVRSLVGLQLVDRGFDSRNLLSLRLWANPGGYAGLDALSYYRSMVQQLAVVPGVKSAALGRYFGTINTQLPEQPIGEVGSAETATTAAMDFVSPGFFETLGIPLIGGRDLQWTDVPSTSRVALVSESVARMLDPNGNVVGRAVRYGTTPAYSELHIVGVVGDISIGNLRKTKERIIWVSAIQSGETTFLSAHLRTVGPPMESAQAAAAVVARMGREHVLGAYEEMLFGNSIVAERMGSAVSTIVAGLALLISCIGVFALLAHAVQQRTREIGIRVAVGATPSAISTLVMRDAVALVVGGLMIGLPGAIAATTVVQSLLYGVSKHDPMMLGLSVITLSVTALVAALPPTWRALRIDPAIALRNE